MQSSWQPAVFYVHPVLHSVSPIIRTVQLLCQSSVAPPTQTGRWWTGFSDLRTTADEFDFPSRTLISCFYLFFSQLRACTSLQKGSHDVITCHENQTCLKTSEAQRSLAETVTRSEHDTADVWVRRIARLLLCNVRDCERRAWQRNL